MEWMESEFARAVRWSQWVRVQRIEKTSTLHSHAAPADGRMLLAVTENPVTLMLPVG